MNSTVLYHCFDIQGVVVFRMPSLLLTHPGRDDRAIKRTILIQHSNCCEFRVVSNLRKVQEFAIRIPMI